MRYTERHRGKAVIKDKRLLPEALEKLAKIEESEQNSMEEITTKLAEYVCDNLCKCPENVTNQEVLDEICSECQLGRFICDILNTYNKINDFADAQCYALLAKYAGFIRCSECEYLEQNKEDGTYWCRNSQGLEYNITPNDGCTRGRRKDG